ncbi:MAG: response regulator [Bacillota bacterium]
MLNNNQNGKVVIIDHSLFMRTTIKILLMGKGCDIFEADEESKAVTLTVNKKPSFILMSLGFAKQNKMKFVKTLKTLHKCPVILYSNAITKEDILQSFSASVDDLLLKPLQQGDRLGRYFLLAPAEIRRYYLAAGANRETNLEFSENRGWTPPKNTSVREGGRMKWDRKAS